MRIAGSTLGTPEQTVPEALALFAAAGLDAAEVIYQDDYRSGLPLRDRRSAERARRASQDLGVPIVGLIPYTTGINALDDADWQAAVDEFRGAIEIAQVVGYWLEGDQLLMLAWGQFGSANAPDAANNTGLP